MEPPKDDAEGEDGGKGSCAVSAARTVLGEGLTAWKDGDVTTDARVVGGDVGWIMVGTTTGSEEVAAAAGFSPSGGGCMDSGSEGVSSTGEAAMIFIEGEGVGSSEAVWDDNCSGVKVVFSGRAVWISVTAALGEGTMNSSEGTMFAELSRDRLFRRLGLVTVITGGGGVLKSIVDVRE